MKVLNTFKKIAAIGVGVAMVGATAMTGLAASYSLASFPAPFADNSGIHAKIILGERAKVSDVIGAINVLAGLSNNGGKTIIRTSKKTIANAQPLYANLGSGSTLVYPIQGQTVSYMPLVKDNMTVTSFLDSNKQLGTSYLNEKFYISYTPGVDTGQNCNTDKVITLNNFTYVFNDSDSNMASYINNGATQDLNYPVTLLGKQYQIHFDKNSTAYQSLKSSGFTTDITLQRGGNQITVNQTSVIPLDSYGFPGYYLKITGITADSVGMQLLKGNSASSATSLGYAQFIKAGNMGTLTDSSNSNVNVQVTVNGVLPSTFNPKYSQAYISFQSGILKAGNYLDPNTKLWKLTTLELNNQSGTPYFLAKVKYNGVSTSTARDLYKCKLYNNEIFLGNSLSLNNHYAISFPSMTQPSTSPFIATYDTTNHRITMSTSGNGYFTINGGTHLTSITLQLSANNNVLNLTNTTYYGVTDVNGNSYTRGTSDVSAPSYIKKSTKVTNGAIKFYVDSSDVNTDNFNILLKSDSLILKSNNNKLSGKTVNDSIELDNDWSLSSVNYKGDVGFGTSSGLLEQGLGQGGIIGPGQTSYYGIKVDQYTSSSVKLTVPDDAIRYMVTLGPGEGATVKNSEINLTAGENISQDIPAGSTVVTTGSVPLKVGLALLDTDVVGSVGNTNGKDPSLSQTNYIVVGGPCINTAAAMLLKNNTQSYCGNDSGIAPGTAIIQLFKRGGDHYSLLVAGDKKENTLAATQILGNYQQYKSKLTGDKVVVTGTISSGISLS